MEETSLPPEPRSVERCFARSSEVFDLLILLVSALSIATIWLAGLYWKLDQMMMSGDAFMWLPRTVELLSQHGAWENLLYRADLIGGVAVADLAGKSPIMDLGGWLGLSATTVLNLSVFVAQLFTAFFGIRSTVDLCSLWGAERRSLIGAMTIIVPLSIIFAFSPYFAARIFAGHIDLLLGNLFFACVLATLVALRLGSLTATFLALTFISLICCLPTAGHQTKLYAVVFGGPILLGSLHWKNRPVDRLTAWIKTQKVAVLSAALLFFGSLAAILPRFVGMLRYAGSGNGVRALTGEATVYSYITSTVEDWLGSLTLHKGLLESIRPANFLHETAYGLGPWILVILALLFARKISWAVGLIVACVLIFLFSSHFSLVSELLTQAVPPLGAFRVPARAAMIVAYALMIAGTTLVLLKVEKSWTWLSTLIGLAFAFAIIALDPFESEIVVWIFAVLSILALTSTSYLPKFNKWIGFGPVLFVLAAANFSAAKDWLPSFKNAEQQIEEMENLGKQVIESDPALAVQLYRIVTTATHPIFEIQAPLAMGLSALSAYANPTRRFLQFLATTLHQEFPPTTVYIPISESLNNFHVLQQLFNVGDRFTIEGNSMNLEKLAPTLGPAWFATSLDWQSQAQALADTLMRQNGDLRPFLKSHLLLDRSDTATSSVSELVVKPECAAAQVESVTQRPNKQDFDVRVTTSTDCPIVLAMNYVDFYRAVGSDRSGQSRELKTFPAYGPLLGVWVPAGTTEVKVEAEAKIPPWTKVAQAMGLFAALMALALVKFNRSKILP